MTTIVSEKHAHLPNAPPHVHNERVEPKESKVESPDESRKSKAKVETNAHNNIMRDSDAGVVEWTDHPDCNGESGGPVYKHSMEKIEKRGGRENR